MEPATSSFPSCQVCGRQKAGNHYHGTVCSCCRIFFLRQTRRTRQPECRGGDGLCSMSPGSINNCKYCRYKKCLEIGMLPNEVGKQKYVRKRKNAFSIESPEDEVQINSSELYNPTKREPRSYQEDLENAQIDSTVIGSQPGNWAVDLYERPEARTGFYHMRTVDSNFSAGFMVLNTLRSAKSASDYISCLVSLHSFVDNPQGVDPIEVYANVEVSLADVLLNSQACSSRAAAAYDKWEPQEDGQFSVKHVYCRSITRYVDYLTAAPELFNLPEVDKMRLIQSNSTDLTLLGAIFEMWRFKIDTSVKYLKTRSNRFQLVSSAQEKLDNLQMVLKPYFGHFMEAMDRLGMITEEFLILKYIVLFTAPIGTSTTGKCIINRAREKYCNLLSSYLIEIDPLMPWTVRLKRVAELISMVRMVKEAALFIKQLYTNFATTNIDGMAGSLTFDLHLREY